MIIRDRNMFPLSMAQAATWAGVAPSEIADAMKRGSLPWRRLRSARVTTPRWLDEWQKGGTHD